MLEIKSLSIVIPARDEESCIAETIRQALKTAAASGLEYEVIVVNDHSCDSTFGLLNELAAENRRVKVFNNPANAGLGAALREGFRQASGDLILYTDADLPCAMSELDIALALMRKDNADIVTAYKSGYERYGLRRMAYSFIYNRIVGILLRVGLRDVNFSFKLFKRDKLAKLDLRSEGSFINAELFAASRRAGYSISEFPVQYLPRAGGKSKLDNFRNIFTIIREMSVFLLAGRRS